MKHCEETTGERPSNDSRDVSRVERLERWRLLGEVTKLWGDAIKVWLKVVAALLAGVAAMLKTTPFH